MGDFKYAYAATDMDRRERVHVNGNVMLLYTSFTYRSR